MDNRSLGYRAYDATRPGTALLSRLEVAGGNVFLRFGPDEIPAKYECIARVFFKIFMLFIL